MTLTVVKSRRRCEIARMESHIETARQAIQSLVTRIKQDSTERIVSDSDAIARAGMEALDSAAAELQLARDSYRTALKALMHRLGDPG